ncbi:MAG: hypothetical protein R3F60_17235 [bacterium]
MGRLLVLCLALVVGVLGGVAWGQEPDDVVPAEGEPAEGGARRGRGARRGGGPG